MNVAGPDDLEFAARALKVRVMCLAANMVALHENAVDRLRLEWMAHRLKHWGRDYAPAEVAGRELLLIVAGDRAALAPLPALDRFMLDQCIADIEQSLGGTVY